MDNLICHCLDVSQTRDDDDDDDVAPTQIYRHGAVSPNLVDSISRDGQKKRRRKLANRIKRATAVRDGWVVCY
jgi:predicted hydrolase (HD superfamily)